jgi:hypothetical protein
MNSTKEQYNQAYEWRFRDSDLIQSKNEATFFGGNPIAINKFKRNYSLLCYRT